MAARPRAECGAQTARVATREAATSPREAPAVERLVAENDDAAASPLRRLPHALLGLAAGGRGGALLR